MTGHADRLGRLAERAHDRLADPEDRIGGQPSAAARVEAVHRPNQTDRSLLHEVVEVETEPAEPLRDRHDEPKVRLDHRAAGAFVA